MKNAFSALLLLILIFDIEAQRLDLDKVSYVYSYRLLPNIALDKTYLSYTVKIVKSDNLGLLASQSDSSKIMIPGRKKVPSQAHFTVNINLGEVIFGKPEVKDRVEITKDKDGKETGRKTLYYLELRYSFEATAKVNDYNGTLLSDYKISSREHAKTYKSESFSNSSQAVEIFNNQKDALSEKLISEEIKNAYSSFNGSLSNDFGIRAISTKKHLWGLGSEKHAEYQAYQNACAIVTSAMALISTDSLPAQIADQIKPAIEYFAGIETKYKSIEDKAEKKLRYAALFNLAQIYLCIEQFDKANEYAQKLVVNDFDIKDGKEFLQEAGIIKARLEKHQMATQHFALDLQHISPPQ